jgi:hypothetical protein
MDALDVSFRLEKQFGIKIGRFDWDRIPCHGKPIDTTAGELHDWVVRPCVEQNIPVTHSSWHAVKKVLAEALHVSPWKITRSSWLKRDLGFC